MFRKRTRMPLMDSGSFEFKGVVGGWQQVYLGGVDMIEYLSIPFARWSREKEALPLQ